jgi:hypothetical protein
MLRIYFLQQWLLIIRQRSLNGRRLLGLIAPHYPKAYSASMMGVRAKRPSHDEEPRTWSFIDEAASYWQGRGGAQRCQVPVRPEYLPR